MIFFHLQKNGVMFQIFETKHVFHACFTVDEEHHIVDAADGSAVSVADVVVEYVTDSAGCFATREDRIVASIVEQYRVVT